MNILTEKQRLEYAISWAVQDHVESLCSNSHEECMCGFCSDTCDRVTNSLMKMPKDVLKLLVETFDLEEKLPEPGS